MLALWGCRDVPDNLLWPQAGDPSCIDRDGDGFGAGCAIGEDCDDGSPELIDECDLCETDHRVGCACTPGQDGNEDFYTGPEGTLGHGVCSAGVRGCVDERWSVISPERTPNAGEICGNDVDDDCDDEIDENTFECANCDPGCHTGGGGDGSWNDDPADRDGIEELPEGGLTLVEERGEFSYAWIANDGDRTGTVSKFNTRTALEEGRYYTGLPDVAANRPSRTAVDRNGDVYVANRAFGEQGSITKIAGTPEACIDRNASGAIETSTGPGDVLAFGEDECVLWSVPLSGVNAVPRALAIDEGDETAPQGYAWVGTFNDAEEGSLRHGRAYKLSPVDGTVLVSARLPIQPYGAIADAATRVWFTAWGEEALVSVSTADGSVGSAISKDEPFGCKQTYGIARDENGALWMGGWSCACAYRYDPAANEWTTVDLRGRGNTRGVGPDGRGNMWIAHSTAPGTLTRVPIAAAGPVIATDDTELVTLEGDTNGTVGVGADFEGHLWLVNRDSSTVTRLDLGTRAQETVAAGLAPYTYSDFTGFQLLSKLTPEGQYEQDFEGCAPGNVDDPNVTEWGDLTWEADVPGSTFLQFVVRTADTEVGLESAQDVIVATVPPDVSPANVGDALEAAGIAPGRYTRVIVRFISQDGVSRPILYRLSLTWICPDVIG